MEFNEVDAKQLFWIGHLERWKIELLNVCKVERERILETLQSLPQHKYVRVEPSEIGVYFMADLLVPPKAEPHVDVNKLSISITMGVERWAEFELGAFKMLTDLALDVISAFGSNNECALLCKSVSEERTHALLMLKVEGYRKDEIEEEEEPYYFEIEHRKPGFWQKIRNIF